MITFNQIHKNFSHQNIISNLSGYIQKNDKIGIIGSNGAGKSTLLLLLANIYKPTKGDIKYDIAKDAIHCISNEWMFYMDMTVYENLYFFVTLNSHKTYLKKIDSSLEYVNLVSKKNKKTSTLSFGMKKRLQIARYLLHQTKILFLDEPFWGLDTQGKKLLHSLLNQQSTFMLVDHEMSYLWEHCNIYWFLKEGKLKKIQYKNKISYKELLKTRDLYL